MPLVMSSLCYGLSRCDLLQWVGVWSTAVVWLRGTEKADLRLIEEKR